MLSLVALVITLGSRLGQPRRSQAKRPQGELFFDPCTSCHPVAPGSIEGGRKLPNDFKGHEIVLEGHDKLGPGEAACVVCHEDAEKNPGMLKTIDGSLVDIKGDVSLVCFRCHSQKYAAWKAGRPRARVIQVHGGGLPRPSHARLDLRRPAHAVRGHGIPVPGPS